MPSAGQLQSAVSSGEVEEVRTLLKARANIEEKDTVGDGAGTSVLAVFVSVVGCVWKFLKSLSCRIGHAAAPTGNCSPSNLGHFVFFGHQTLLWH
jgi:hypothetical protein